MMAWLPYGLAAAALLGGVGVVLAQSPARAASRLWLSMVALAGLYLLSGAALVGVVHLVAYSCACLLLMVATIGAEEVAPRARPGRRVARAIGAGVVAFGTAAVVGIALRAPSRGRSDPVLDSDLLLALGACSCLVTAAFVAVSALQDSARRDS